MGTDHQLLVGLLGLQNGLISQAQLLAGFQAWTLDRSRGLADHLVALGHLVPAQRTVLEGMAVLHLEAHGGTARSGNGRAAEPDDGETAADLDRTVDLSIGAATSNGQRFRLLRPHARGGLGAVFVALDSELKREVALKQILDQHADDPTSRQRFVAEAEITGGLEHPGVVPVYGLGSYADGRPYYAMRFIRGESLKEAIESFHRGGPAGGRPLELRKLLRRFLDVCNAIDYAHSRGVIHRDIKPANIILGQHGETLVVDWGLAKAVGRADPSIGERTIAPSSGSSSETLPGSALGTPAYMSPEQARGELDALGPCSDVYSLGATLYCLLTGKPPFEADDLGAILRAVEAGRFATPRQLDPSLDRPLEAICLKAMATEPQDRYPSAKALADDLERWMADEPVTAWREPVSRWLRRWSRRHRTAVTAATVAGLTLLAGLAAVATVERRSNDTLRGLNGRLERANTELADEKARVQQQFALALDSIRTLQTGVSDDFLLREEQFKGLRDRLLRTAADFHDRLGGLLKGRSDRDSRQALASAEFELADLTGKVGDATEALKRHQEVLSLRESLASEPGVDAESQADAAVSLLEVGQAQLVVGQTAEAEASLRAAQERLARLAAAHPDSIPLRADLASTEWNLAKILRDTGRKSEGLALLESARDARAAQAAAAPGDATRQPEWGKTQYDVASALFQAGRLSQALEAASQGEAILERCVAAAPDATEALYELGLSQKAVGLTLAAQGQTDAALAVLDRMRKTAERLVATNPALTQSQLLLAHAYGNLGFILHFAGREHESLEATERALEIDRKLVHDHPSVFDFRDWLAVARSDQAGSLAYVGRLSEALEVARDAVVVARGMVASNPEMTRSRLNLAMALISQGRAEARLGRRSDAASTLRAAIAITESLPESRNLFGRFYMTCARSLLAGVLDGEEARAEADRAIAAAAASVAGGLRDLTAFRNEPDMDLIRPRPEFQLLLLDMAFPEDPFAP